MKGVEKYPNELVARYPVLNSVYEDILKAYQIIVESYLLGGKMLIAGNGGSAADAEHIVGELMKSFVRPRRIGTEFRDDPLPLGFVGNRDCCFQGHDDRTTQRRHRQS